jgi:MoxR-like ATPase
MNKEKVDQLINKIPLLKAAIHKTIIGQDQVIDQLIVGLIASGHVLLEGVPGLAKTLLIKSLAQALDLSFKRIQFTPDLMPSDILGTEILQEDNEGNKYFKFAPGPVFTHILLADEINRTPPKTQSALLELMQEYHLTYAGQRYELPKPFFLLATQNPIEQSGTFPLPEAQVDRFLLFVKVSYPTEVEENQILKLTTGVKKEGISSIYNAEEIMSLQDLCRQVHIDEALISSVSSLVRATRPQSTQVEMVKEYIDWGAGPRAGQSLILASKAFALMNGRYAVIPQDIKEMIMPTMRHRLILNFRALSEKIEIEDVINHLISKTKIG